MRTTLLFLALALSAGSSYSQPYGRMNLHNSVLNALLQPQQTSLSAAYKTTAVTKYRVIAQSTIDNSTSSVVDSLDVSYTGLRGSTYDYNLMLYPYNYPYSNSPMFNYLGNFTKPQVLYDTCLRWTIDPFTNNFGMYEWMYATYDTNKLLRYKDLFADSVLNKNMTYTNTFNTAGNITRGLWFNYNLGLEDSAFKQFFAYNAANKLVKDSIYEYRLGAWKLVSKTFYTYDAANNLTQIDQWANTTDTTFTLPLVQQLKYVNTYDASNRLKTVLTSLFDGTALTDYVKDTFAYTGTASFHTSWKQHQWDPINTYWAPQLYMQKHLNSLNLPDTVHTYTFDSIANAWFPYYRDVVTYNAQNNPEKMMNYVYNWTSFPSTPNFTTTYYYESYLDATGTKSLPGVAHSVSIYPNPATSHVTISATGIAVAEPVTVSFVNTAGQVISRQQLPYRSGMQVSTGELAAGVYAVVLHNSAGAVVATVQLVKQ